MSASELAVQVMVPFGLDTLTLRGSWFDLETPGRSSSCPALVASGVGARFAAAAAGWEAVREARARIPWDAFSDRGSASTVASAKKRDREGAGRIADLLPEETRCRRRTCSSL